MNPHLTQRVRVAWWPVLACMAAALALTVPLRAEADAKGDGKPKADPAPAATEGINLRPRLVEGRRSRYSGWTLRQQNMSMSLNGQSRTAATRMEVNSEVTWTVDHVKSDGSASCTMTVDWLTVTLTGAEGETKSVDSRRSSGDPETLYRLAKALTGLPVKVEMAADGSVISATGAEAIKRRLGNDIPAPTDLDFMESATDLASIALAPAQAAIGTRWDASFAWSHEMGTLYQAMKYTVVSEEEVEGIPLATVTGRATLRLEVDPSKLPPAGGPKVDVKLVRGTVDTQVMFDLQRGEAVGRNTTQQTLIEVKIHLPNNVTMQRTVDETLQGQALRISEE
ncbi:MAG: hypothetical protein K8S99_18255 [Planctomycetes bacterium]|nr:hypothetical protein [Planctomycetota bacterium]